MNQLSVIVTGAGSGIGRATALRLAASGHRIALVGRRQTTLDETAALINEPRSGTPLVVTADHSVSADADRVIETAQNAWGGVDALVNNAGQAVFVPLADTDDDTFSAMLKANALGPAYLIRAIWPHFAARGRGKVVNVSSRAAHDPFPGLAAYAAAKAAAESFVRSIRNEGDALGIQAWAVAPGAVETAMLRSGIDEATLPRDQTLDPDEVARVIADLIEGRHSAASGTTVIL